MLTFPSFSRLIFVFVVFAFLVATKVNAQQFELEDSKITFEIKNAGFKVDGVFHDFEVMATINKSNILTSSFTAVINVGSLETGIKARDKHLKNEDYFDVSSYPTIRFESQQVYKDKNIYKLRGNLTMKDVVKNIEIPFKVLDNGNKQLLEGNFSLNRLDYNVGKKSWVLSNNVDIYIKCTFTFTEE